MMRPRPGIGTELLPVLLVLGSLAGTWVLVVSMHRRAVPANVPAPPVVVAPPPAPPPPRLVTTPKPRPPKSTPTRPPADDPTRQALARIGSEEAVDLLEAQAADRKAEALDAARRSAEHERARWRAREMIVREQLDALSERARMLDAEADALALERDVLARERDAAKAALAKARTRSSYAVLPHKGPNGTWRRPIIIECRNGGAQIMPNGPTFSLLDLSPLMGMRSSPLIHAVSRVLFQIQSAPTPDGAPSVPYIFFVIRPDGVRPYYEARGRLEPLGISFGYELVDQDRELDYPDLDNTESWDGTTPLPLPVPVPPRTELADTSNPLGSPPSLGSALPARSRAGREDGAETFVWPTRSPGAPGGIGGDLAELDALHSLPPGRGIGGSGSGDRPGTDPEGRDGSSRDPYERDGFGRGGNGVTQRPETGDPMLGLPSRPGRMLARVGDGTRTGSGMGMGGGTGLTPLSPDRLPGLEAAAPGRPLGATGAAGRATTPGAADSTGSGNLDLPPLPGEVPPGNVPGGGAIAGQAGMPSRGGGVTNPGAGDRSVASSSGGAPRAFNGMTGTPPQGAAGWAGEAQGIPIPLNMAGAASQFAGSQSPFGPSNRAGSGAGAQASASAPDSARQPFPVGSGAESESAFPDDFPPAGGGSGSSPGGTPGMPGRNGANSEAPRNGPRGASDPDHPPLRIEMPLDIVVACRPDGVVIHPGGYRLSPKALKGKELMLAKDLATIVRNRQQIDPTIRPVPSVTFLVEPGGGETFRDARRQTVLSGLKWPTAIQVGDTRVLGGAGGRF